VLPEDSGSGRPPEGGLQPDRNSTSTLAFLTVPRGPTAERQDPNGAIDFSRRSLSTRAAEGERAALPRRIPVPGTNLHIVLGALLDQSNRSINPFGCRVAWSQGLTWPDEKIMGPRRAHPGRETAERSGHVLGGIGFAPGFGGREGEPNQAEGAPGQEAQQEHFGHGNPFRSLRLLAYRTIGRRGPGLYSLGGIKVLLDGLWNRSASAGTGQRWSPSQAHADRLGKCRLQS
jgi:hypothetical protein